MAANSCRAEQIYIQYILMLEIKDKVTADHSRRVAGTASYIGCLLGMPDDKLYDLEVSALLHDVGKLLIPDRVLKKKDNFTHEDYQLIKRHTINGAGIMEDEGLKPEIIDGILHHHERVDRLGYPDGLCGDEMSTFAKIIKIADVYDALVSKRQYKDSWNTDSVLRTIYAGRGTEFDEVIVNIFIESTRQSS